MHKSLRQFTVNGYENGSVVVVLCRVTISGVIFLPQSISLYESVSLMLLPVKQCVDTSSGVKV
jgi:hypothetical protein